MCTKYKVCGKSHRPKWQVSKIKRNSRGQFVQGYRTLTAVFLGIVFVGSVSMLGINQIWSWAKSLEKTIVVGNSYAEETITITWQDEVKSMLRNAGINVDFASELIQCESSWN